MFQKVILSTTIIILMTREYGMIYFKMSRTTTAQWNRQLSNIIITRLDGFERSLVDKHLRLDPYIQTDLKLRQRFVNILNLTKRIFTGLWIYFGVTYLEKLSRKRSYLKVMTWKVTSVGKKQSTGPAVVVMAMVRPADCCPVHKKNCRWC